MLDQFYSIKNKKEEGTITEVEVELNADHPVYTGHFPGMPVVPGVCTLMMVKECAEWVSGRKYTYRYLNSCKFLSAIRPDRCTGLRILLEFAETTGSACTLQARVFAEGTAALKLKANLMVR